ncbi:MAG: hypothetical protein R2769_12860 [Saprospiraceae bacterium]
MENLCNADFGGVFVYFGADYTIYSITQLSAAAGIPSQIIALSMVSWVLPFRNWW